ncbi:MAG: hypothetical protein A2Z20_12240, partial [Bdellovibrionales bacterium RBG_16_40_8]
MNQRNAVRKSVEAITIQDLTSVTTYMVIASEGKIINASNSGFLIQIDRHSLVPEDLRENLSLQSILGQSVVMYLPQMNLDLDGTISRATHMGRGIFVIAVTFSNEVPEYWRECLVDLLPAPGEF